MITDIKTRDTAKAKAKLAEANARLNAAAAKLEPQRSVPHIYHRGERQAAEAKAEKLMSTGIYGARPGVRQLLPMLIELQGMARNFAATETAYSGRYAAAVTAEFAKASDAIRTLIDLSREA